MHRPLCALLAAALLAASACSGSDDTGAAGAQPQPGNGDNGAKSRAAGGAGAAGGTDNGGAGSGGAPGGPGGRPTPSITLAAQDVAVVKRGSIEEAVMVTGDLRPIETVEIRARVEGDLEGVFVREGQQVTTGQLLARFEDSEQESALQSARADKLAAESENTTAKWNLDQTTELFRAGAVAERDFKLAQQTAATATARLAAADARVRAATSLLGDTRALATTNGVISARTVENGEHVSRGTSMFTLVRTNVLELVAAVPARHAAGVKVGQAVLFNADGRSFEGKVARVSPTVDPTTRSVMVYVQIPNESDGLKGGTFAAGRVVSRTLSKVLVLPAAAVRIASDGQQYVYRLAGRAIDVANVQLGVVDERGGVAEVLDGVAEGDRVVIGNVGALGRGMQVIIAGEESPAGGPGRSGRGGQSKQAPPAP